jgi:hypothetical protein
MEKTTEEQNSKKRKRTDENDPNIRMVLIIKKENGEEESIDVPFRIKSNSETQSSPESLQYQPQSSQSVYANMQDPIQGRFLLLSNYWIFYYQHKYIIGCQEIMEKLFDFSTINHPTIWREFTHLTALAMNGGINESDQAKKQILLSMGKTFLSWIDAHLQKRIAVECTAIPVAK